MNTFRIVPGLALAALLAAPAAHADDWWTRCMAEQVRANSSVVVTAAGAVALIVPPGAQQRATYACNLQWDAMQRRIADNAKAIADGERLLCAGPANGRLVECKDGHIVRRLDQAPGR
jgi:hypothetical protein